MHYNKEANISLKMKMLNFENENIENSKLAYQNIKKQDQLDELNKQVKDFLKQNPIPKTKEAQIN